MRRETSEATSFQSKFRRRLSMVSAEGGVSRREPRLPNLAGIWTADALKTSLPSDILKRVNYLGFNFLFETKMAYFSQIIRLVAKEKPMISAFLNLRGDFKIVFQK